MPNDQILHETSDTEKMPKQLHSLSQLNPKQLQELNKLKQVITENGIDEALFRLSNNYYDEKTIQLFMNQLPLPKSINHMKILNIISKQNQANIAIREIEIESLNKYNQTSEIEELKELLQVQRAELTLLIAIHIPKLLYPPELLYLPENHGSEMIENLRPKDLEKLLNLSEIQEKIKTQRIQKTLDILLANSYHDEHNITFILNNIDLAESIDREKEIHTLTRKNQNNQKQIIDQLNKYIETKGVAGLNELITKLKVNKEFTIITDGFRDGNSISFIIDHLNLPDSTNRLFFKNSLISRNHTFVVLNQLSSMVKTGCEKQAFEIIFDRTNLPKHIVKALRKLTYPKALAQIKLDTETYQKEFIQEKHKKSLARSEKETQLYIKSLQKQPNEIETFLDKVFLAKQQIQNQINIRKRPLKEEEKYDHKENEKRPRKNSCQR
ncbi:hypothetical protein [Enterococcus villorum]|uniref:hypothetical protein n=1 Tax=Enterococcus villorum TaxID=112904 RepID=UPI0009BEB7E7|nr:hypothetical protein [Enterococcus villorum]OQO76015.1 hypothetical protein BH744_05470 [Enterococcus villorum]